MESDGDQLNVIRYGNVFFKFTKRTIGYWGNQFKLLVHNASVTLSNPILPYPYGDLVSIKMVDEPDSLILIQQQLNDEEAVKNQVRNRHILFHHHSFKTKIDKKKMLCVVLPSEKDVISIRQNMLSHSTVFGSGIPEDCVAIALYGASKGLRKIHLAEKTHKSLSCGTIYYDRAARNVKLAYGAALYERLNPGDEGVCAMYKLTEWARAPEVVDNNDIYYSPAADVWLIGIAAMEMCYGKVEVDSREELLLIADYVSTNRIMPYTWDELRQKVSEKCSATTFETLRKTIPSVVTHCMSLVSPLLFRNNNNAYRIEEAPRFSTVLVEFVSSCLERDPNKRPSSIHLPHNTFFKHALRGMQFFENRLDLV